MLPWKLRATPDSNVDVIRGSASPGLLASGRELPSTAQKMHTRIQHTPKTNFSSVIVYGFLLTFLLVSTGLPLRLFVT